MTNSSQWGWQPDWAVAPGENLLEALRDRGMTQSELAQRLGRPLKTVNEIVKAKAAITPETAIQLERVLGISARFWTGLETQYRDSLARQEAQRELARQSDWATSFPIADLVKHGLMGRGNSKAETLANLLSYLGVSSPAAFNRFNSAAAYRASPAFEASPKAVAAWLRWGEIEASRIDTAPFDARRFRQVLVEVRGLTRRMPFDQIFKRVKSLCASAGVAVVVTPELSGTHLSGASRWLGSKAVIQLSMRYRTDDQLWFTFYHEAGHLLSGSRHRDFVDGSEDTTTLSGDHDEELANNFARDVLLPPGDYRSFLEANDFSRASIRTFAKEQQVASGIVVGRLQRDGYLSASQLNDLKNPIRLSFEA
jgi:HTH-type transcriptional regulator / antitoxin HigA